MSYQVITKSYKLYSFCEKEILRYAGVKNTESQINALLKECLDIAKNEFCFKVCFSVFPVSVYKNCCSIGEKKIRSEHLSALLKDCKNVVIMAATTGVALDRQIAKYSVLSPAKAHMLGAIGAERIEALCDTFCKDLEKETGLTLTPRFSAGYGDVDICEQKWIFDILNPQKHIGLSLTESFVMTPSKSVTEFIGLKGDK